MINLLQETKKKVEAKNLLSRFPEFNRRSIFAAALYEKLAAEANQFVPAENILKSEANIGLLGQEDECECLSELFFMRAHGIIHDACGRAYCEMGVGKGYCSLGIFPGSRFASGIERNCGKSLSKNFFN